MALVQQDLRRDVLGRAAERVGPRTGLDDLGKAEVGELGIAVGTWFSALKTAVFGRFRAPMGLFLSQTSGSTGCSQA